MWSSTMKINEIYEKFLQGERLTIKNKGQIKAMTKLPNGKFEIKFTIPEQPKFYGRLTHC